MPAHKAYDQPSTVSPVDGEVTIDGPDGVGLSMTPDAAHRTGERLRDAATEARGQSRRAAAEEDDED